MSFVPRNFVMFKPPIVTRGVSKLLFVDSTKYLGHYLSSDLSDDVDIKNQLKQFCIRSNTIIRSFACCTPQVKSFLFKSFCGNFYSMPLWCNAKVSTLNRIRVCYNNGFRLLHRLDWRCSASQMFVSNHVRSFREIQRRIAYSFLTSLNCHPNKLMNLTTSASIARKSKIQTSCRKLLYINCIL